jgi:[acyl-carrier-protein] S-malonyltransferase
MGLEEAQIRQVCRAASSEGIVQSANFNSPGQVVISGSVSGVHRAMDLAKEAGAKLVKELVVSGAFHSPLMEPARESLFAALEELDIHVPRCPVYANVSAQPLREPDQIRRALKEQLLSPVLWAQSVTAMIAAGAAKFVEVGPGNVLNGLLKRIDKNAAGLTAGTVADLEKSLEILKA